MSFSDLGLSAPVLKGIEAMGYREPTPIQAQAIPLVLQGRDVIGGAQTGTGKTAAFGLPMLTRMVSHRREPRALILEPTRELAAQVDEAMREFARFTDLKIAVIYGGVGYGGQIQAFKDGVDVLVATPGRLIDHLQQGNIKLNAVDFAVLDEADRMLDMGFLPDVKRILLKCPKERQTMLFSATIPPAIETLVQWAMKDPETVEIGNRHSPAETVKHVLYPVASAQKEKLLLALLEEVNYESVIVFCRTKQGADLVGNVLKQNGHSATVIHSDRNQRDREKALQGFRKGWFEVLVATDVASRGLDIKDVSHVVNYDVPQHPEDYVHRIGRTGRAEASGDAFTIMVAEDATHVQAVERFIDKPIPREKLKGFTYKYTALFDHERDGVRPHDRKFKAVRVSGGYHYSAAGGKRGRRRKR